MPKKNEFLRGHPAPRSRNVVFDLSNLIIPVLIVILGIIAATQTYCRLVNYAPFYTGEPLLILKHRLLWLPEQYRFYNPLMVFLIILSHPFDGVINAVLFRTYAPLLAYAGIAVFAFFAAAAIRGYGLNRNDRLYGSARWATEKDLERFGLTQERGVVLGEFQEAKLDFAVNPENASLSLSLKKAAPLVCHAGGTNTLLLAPTRSGKGVSSIIPTCLNYPYSMIIFDPKGELYFHTAGFRRRFSHILKFSPLSEETICFNPLEEIELTEQAFADVGLILGNMFEEPRGGNDGTSSFFDNNAKDILTGLILHILTAKDGSGENFLYPPEKKCLSGVLSVLSAAGAEKGEGEEGKPAEALLAEMMGAKHYDKFGNESPMLHDIVYDCAARCKGQNPKVQADVFATVYSKMNLFADPRIKKATGRSDFKLQDFYDSEYPITLYLTVPFSDLARIAPVFKTLLNFMLNKFSRGEASYGELELKHRILFLLDEFSALGNFPFVSKTLAILAGYGINFYVVVQALSQLIDLYGQHQAFLDNCKTVVVYAPGKIEDAKMFTEMIGKESVVKESIGTSGSRYAASLNNLSESSQEVSRDLMNPDELMKLPPTEALILNQGMPPYIAKKVVYYQDPRFKDKAYSPKAGTGFQPPVTRQALLDLITDPAYGLPSQRGKGQAMAEPKGQAAEPKGQAAGADEDFTQRDAEHRKQMKKRAVSELPKKLEFTAALDE